MLRLGTYITINSDSYTKRTKIITGGVWTNTIPNVFNNIKKMYHTKAVYINYFDKQLIVYRPNMSLIVYHPDPSLITPCGINLSKLKHSDLIELIYSWLLLTLLGLLYLTSFLLGDDDIDSMALEKLHVEESYKDKSNVEEKDTDYEYFYFNSFISMFKSSRGDKTCSVNQLSNPIHDDKCFTLNNFPIGSSGNIPDTINGEKSSILNNIPVPFGNNTPNEITIDKDDTINKEQVTVNTNLDKVAESIFTPFTPNTLETLKHEIDSTDKAIKDIINSSDTRKLSIPIADKLSRLMEEHQYFLSQHKNHLESLVDRSNESIGSIESKLSEITDHETRLSEMRTNLINHKLKLVQDVNNSSNDLTILTNVRKSSTGIWKKSLSKEEIKLIEELEDKVIKDTIKNRIELENKD